MKLLIQLSMSFLLLSVLTTTEGSVVYNTDGEKLQSILTTIEGFPVNDTDGEKLVAGKWYHILFNRTDPGGLCHWGFSGKLDNYTCPLTLGLTRLACDPVARFYPVNENDTFVQRYTDLNIVFPNSGTCFPDPPVWKLADADEATGRRYVTTGGTKGNPGAATLSNWFKIQGSSGNYYKLLYCPSVCPSCDFPCAYLGIHYENGKRLLGLKGEPFKVAFRKKQPVCPPIGCLSDGRGPYQE